MAALKSVILILGLTALPSALAAQTGPSNAMADIQPRNAEPSVLDKAKASIKIKAQEQIHAKAATVLGQHGIDATHVLGAHDPSKVVVTSTTSGEADVEAHGTALNKRGDGHDDKKHGHHKHKGKGKSKGHNKHKSHRVKGKKAKALKKAGLPKDFNPIRALRRVMRFLKVAYPELAKMDAKHNKAVRQKFHNKMKHDRKLREKSGKHHKGKHGKDGHHKMVRREFVA